MASTALCCLLLSIINLDDFCGTSPNDLRTISENLQNRGTTTDESSKKYKTIRCARAKKAGSAGVDIP